MNKTNKIPFARKIAKKKETVTILSIVCSLFFITASCGKSDFGVDADGDPLYDFYLYTNRGKPYDYYYIWNNKEIFDIRKDRVIIKSKNAKELSNNITFMSTTILDNIMLATINPEKTKLEDLWKMEGVIDATYGLSQAGYYRSVSYPNDVISVSLKEGVSPEQVLKKIGLTKSVRSIELIFSDNKYHNDYYINLNEKLGDILMISRRLYETGLCVYSTPMFFREMPID